MLVACQPNSIQGQNEQKWRTLKKEIDQDRRQGNASDILPKAELAYEAAEEAFGPADHRTLNALEDLAGLHARSGELGHAERLYLKAIGLRSGGLDLDSSQPIENEHNLALLYKTKNDLAGIYLAAGLLGEARGLIEDVSKSRSESFGDSHPNTLVSLGTFANLHSRQENYDEAIRLLSKIIKTTEERIEKDDPKLPVMGENRLLRYKQKLAEAYSAQGRHQEAETLHQRVLDRRIAKFGEEDLSTLSSMGQLALVSHRQGRYGESLALFEKVADQRRDIVGPYHPLTFSAELGAIYALIKLGRFDEAIAQLSESSQKRLVYTKSELTSARGAVRRSSILALQGIFQNVGMSLALEAQSKEAIELAGKLMLDWKQVEGPEIAFLARQIRSANDENTRQLAIEVKELRIRLTKLARGSGEQDELFNVLEELETKELELATVTDRLERTVASVDKIKQALPPRTAVIEFRQYRAADFDTGKEGEAYFAALLIQRNQEPKLVTTGEISSISRHLGTILDDHDSARSRQAAGALYDLLLSGLADDLNDVEKLYVAPDGILYLLPFDRLILPDGSYWGERIALRILPTSRELLSPEKSDTGFGLLALGGVNFESSDQDMMSGSSETGSTIEASRPSIEPAGIATVRGQIRDIFEEFDPLPGSQDEVERIAKLYREKRPEAPTHIWTGAAASESRLKSLDGLTSPPRILHIATHGFYLPEQFQNLSRPHLYSGIVLAAANQALEDKDLEEAESSEDGILYSIEAQDLDLEGTDLIVLSACETAKGVVDYSEGILGMVQALRIAGAKRILTTLWPVLDKPTAAFMETFYENWLNDAEEDAAVALDLTKKMFREHQNPDYRSPRVWAPFVLIGT